MCLGIPGKIIEFLPTAGLKTARVDFGGVLREVCIEALPEAQIGDYVIVHAGFALNLLSEEEAQATLDTLRELSEFEAQLGEDLTS